MECSRTSESQVSVLNSPPPAVPEVAAGIGARGRCQRFRRTHGEDITREAVCQYPSLYEYIVNAIFPKDQYQHAPLIVTVALRQCKCGTAWTKCCRVLAENEIPLCNSAARGAWLCSHASLNQRTEWQSESSWATWATSRVSILASREEGPLREGKDQIKEKASQSRL